MSGDDDGGLFDEDAGPLVRPYAFTGGRTASTRWDLLTLLHSTGKVALAHVEPEPGEVLMLCHQPVSIAEVAAQLRLPAMVVRVLVDDLMEVDAVQALPPAPYDEGPSKELLEALLTGLQRRL